MSYSDCQVRLQRDALSTPWGFRLQGGKDFKTPLTVQRVFVGSPADGELHRGDIISAIQSRETSYMSHKEAQDLIKASGGAITLSVRRAGQTRPASTPITPTSPHTSPGLLFRPKQQKVVAPVSFTPKAPTMQSGVSSNMGVDYSKLYGSQPQYAPQYEDPMLHKVKDSLTDSILQAHEDDYQAKSVSDIKGIFSHSPQPSHHQRHRPAAHRHPPQHNILAEQQEYQQYQQPSHQQQPQYQQPSHQQQPQYQQPSHQQQPQYQPSHPPQYQQPPQEDHREDTGYHTHVWQKPAPGIIGGNLPSGLTDPGWTPGCTPHGTTSHPSVRAPRMRPSPPPPINRPQPGVQPFSQQPRHLPTGKPAWAGSLKSSGGPKFWEMKDAEGIAPGSTDGVPQQAPYQAPAPAPAPAAAPVSVHNPRVQKTHFAPGMAPQYQQGGDDVDSDTARVAHLQYNTPIGLYSKKKKVPTATLR